MKYMQRYTGLLLGVIALCVTSCGHTEKNSSPATNEAKVISLSGTSVSASCPYMTENAGGIPVVSWIQKDSASKMNYVHYALFSDSSQTFTAPEIIPTTKGAKAHGEDMPKMLFQKDGHILVVFAVKNPHPGNPYTAAVHYSWSFDGGRSWTPAEPLIKDSATSYDQRYFDVATLADGKAAIIWLNNSTPKGSTLYFATLNGQKGVEDPVIVASHTCQCCRTDILVDSTGKINIAWRDIFQDSIRDMMYAYSNDMGKSFSAPVRISKDNWVVDGCPHTGPSMAENKDGLHFSWFTMGGGSGVFYCQTSDGGKIFSHRQTVNSLPSSRHPQMATLPDNDLAIVWDGGVTDQDRMNQRIGLQMRGPNGLLLGTRYLTPDSINADFPVIKILGDKSALIAYSQSKGDKSQVKYQIVSLGL